MKFITLFIFGFFIINIAECQAEKNDSIVNFIKAETKGGKLDFKAKLIKEGKDKSLLGYKGVAYNINNYAILLWGQAVKRLGIKSLKDAVKLWEEIYKRKMTKPEKTALKNGFKAVPKQKAEGNTVKETSPDKQ